MEIRKIKGFTLIELLVVIAIISLLSSIVFASVSSAREKAQDTHKLVESKEVVKAIELYRLDNNYAVPSSSSSNVLHAEDSVEYIAAMNQLVEGGYIPAIPESPSGNDYAYMVSDDGLSAMFFSNQSGGSGGGDVCRRIGDETFGQTGDGDSCEGTVVEGESGVTYCGLPPFISSISSETYYSFEDDWRRTVSITDPEGGDIVFDYYSSLQMESDGATCGVSGVSGNQLTLSCTQFGGSSAYVSFDYYTSGCSSQIQNTGNIPFDFY